MLPSLSSLSALTLKLSRLPLENPRKEFNASMCCKDRVKKPHLVGPGPLGNLKGWPPKNGLFKTSTIDDLILSDMFYLRLLFALRCVIRHHETKAKAAGQSKAWHGAPKQICIHIIHIYIYRYISIDNRRYTVKKVAQNQRVHRVSNEFGHLPLELPALDSVHFLS